MPKILIVDDEEKIGKLIAAELGDAGHDASYTTDSRDALKRASDQTIDIVITDLRMPAMDGISLLKKIRAKANDTDVIMMTAYASVETALTAMKEGAYDYILKPFTTEALLHVVSRLEEKRRLEAQVQDLRHYLNPELDQQIVGNSVAMMDVKRMITGLADSDAPVLIRGESGTGKELVAKAVHASSRRAEGPFIALNCAAIPEALLESELFGYERGAFTGADRRKLGRFQLADGGTLFLDEIGDLPGSLQAKLLRVLEDKRVAPLGATRDVSVDIRLVSATHRPLEAEIELGNFRRDLYYRLNVFPIFLPPLRERREDVRTLAERFLAKRSRPAVDLGSDAVVKLAAYDWPGNVRELHNVLERALILNPEGKIGAEAVLTGTPVPPSNVGPPDSLNLAEVERQVIMRALDAASGNKSEAARLLGITRRSLYGRLERYGIE